MSGWAVALGFVYGVVFTAIALVLGRALFGAMRPFSRIGGTLLRLFGAKSVGRTRSVRAASAAASAPVGPDHLTAIEWALMQPDAPVKNPGDASVQLYDLAEERRILKTHGQAFKWLRVPAEYIPETLSESFSPDKPEIADTYFKEAQDFFSRPVALLSNELNFYEDEEGAVIVSMFRNSDRRCFFALDQLRRVINANARRSVVWLTWPVVCAPAVVLGAAFAWRAMGPIVDPIAKAALFGMAGMILFGILFAASQFIQTLYANDQRQNMREFSDFLTRYMSFIGNQFRDASATASRVIQGDERDSKRLAAAAQKWHKIMIWLGLRPFFIESFVRNVNFQIRRNLRYYLTGAVIWFVIVLPSMVGVVAYQTMQIAPAFQSPSINVVLVAAMITATIAAGFVALWQMQKRVILEELNQTNWLGYENLDIGRQIDEVIGKYAEDIGLWKGRFDR
jgi:hypothetical protein